MTKEIEKIILEKYEEGLNSHKISALLGISSPTVLKVLNRHGVVRQRDRCKALDIKEENGKFYLMWECPRCHNLIRRGCKHKTILCRNHFNQVKTKATCRKCSFELQHGEGNSFYGKKHTKESLIKISESRKGKYKGDKHYMRKEENKLKMGEKLKLAWASGKHDHLREEFSERMKNTRRMGKIKSTIKSKAETTLINQLKDINIIAVQSFRVDTKTCDIYIPSLNLIIEYFGKYWHCDPRHYKEDYFNIKKNQTAKEIWEYDRKKLELIKSYGYNLEVIWEIDFKNNNKLLLSIIEKYVKN